MDILLWLFILELFGIIGMPLSSLLLNQTFDRGIVSAKIIGLLIFAFTIWTFGYLAIIPTNRSFGIILFLILLSTAIFVILLKRKFFKLILKDSYKNIAICEILFVITFLCFALIKSMNSQISHTEQPMDFAFLNSVFYSLSYPPIDPWFSGHTIQYYYLGYLIFAWPAKLIGISPQISYNLALISIPALSACITFSIIATISIMLGITRKFTILLSFLGVLIQNILGNMQGVLEIIRGWGYGSVNFWSNFDIKGFEEPISNVSLIPNQHWWWWKASRIIDTIHFGESLDYTIQEFPFFSFFLGDLHPHFMSMPFMLLFLALFLNFLTPKNNHVVNRYEKYIYVIFIGLIVGAIGFINTWNLPTCIGMGILMIIFREINSRKLDMHVLKNIVFLLCLFIFSIFAPFANFYLTTINNSYKISPYLGEGTSSLHFVIVWGFFLITAFPITLLGLPKNKSSYFTKLCVSSIIISILPVAIWILMTPEIDPLLLRFKSTNMIVILLLFITLIFGLINSFHHNFKNSSTHGIVLLFTTTGILLIFGTEFFFVLDSFGSRMNTIFKAYYQIWILFSISSPIGIYLIIKHLHSFFPKWKFIYSTLLAITFISAISYPTAVLISTSQNTFTLDGMFDLKINNPEEYEAIKWLQSHRKPGDVILETWGQDYTEHSRFSAFTGMATIMGWPGHQLQWRGNSIEHQSRLKNIDKIYLGKDKNVLNKLINKYKINYIILGNREKNKYNIKNLENLSGSIKLVYSNNTTQIYKTITIQEKNFIN